MKWRQIYILMIKEIRDARRNRWFIVVSVLFGLLSVSLSLLGLSGLGTVGIAGFGRTAASLLNLILLIVPLMALLLGAMSITGEKEQGTLMTLLAQPVSVSEVFWGKFLGTAAALTTTLCVGFGLSGLVIAKYAGLDQISGYLILVGFTILLGICFLSIGFCVSVFSKRHATAVGTSIFLWFLFLFLSDLGLMGTAVILKLSARDLLWFVIINPAQSFKLAVIGSLQKSLEAFGAAGLYAYEIFGERLPMFLVFVMVVWIGVSLIAAFLFFRKKCID